MIPSPMTNPFRSLDETISENTNRISTQKSQLSLAPTPPSRAQLPKARHDYFGLFPHSSARLSRAAESEDPFATPPPSIYADSIQNISSPNISRPIFPSSRPPSAEYHSNQLPALSSIGTSVKSLSASLYGNESSEKLASVDESVPLVPTKSALRVRLRNVTGATKRAFLKHVDPKTILEMVDFRELVYPYNPLKYFMLALVGMAVAGIVVSEHYTHWIDKSMSITRRNMLPVLIIVIGLEPIMIAIILFLVRIPDLPKDQIPEKYVSVADKEEMQSSAKAAEHVGSSQMDVLEKTKGDVESRVQISELNNNEYRTALVIPCHNSDERAVKIVLESAYKHFRPQDIFIVDNGRTKYPPDNFRAFIRSQHPDIVYIWSPIGSKNAAQLIGSLAARSYEFIMTVDDDVSIPTNFRAPVHKINHLTKGVAFSLRAIDARGQCPLFMVGWQDCEYKMSGLSKLAESNVCGVLYPHGAGWFCERDTLIDLISNYHSLDFIAEDVNTGLSMQKMKKRIAFDPQVVLETEVPTTVFGSGLNWWSQRKNSWEMGRHGRLLGFAGRLLLSLNGQTTPHGIFAQKFIHMYAICSIVVDWLRIPVFITMGSSLIFWRQALLLMLSSMIPLLIFKFISARRRPDLQPGFWASVTYPVYKQMYATVSIIGAIRSVTWYIGGHKKPKTVNQMVKEEDERVFWLDPRFEHNPGFLADEGAALGLIPGVSPVAVAVAVTDAPAADVDVQVGVN